MALLKKHLLIFGGFHDNLRDCKYFNDLHAFDIENMKWKKLEVTGSVPSPRSACVLFTLPENRGLVVFGGYFREKGKKDSEKGVTLSDMHLLTPDKHDTTMTKWRWQTVKQTGARPSVRSGMSAATAPNGKVFVFGGVQDVKDDDDELEGKFFNELYSVHVEGEKATWQLIELSGKRDEAERKSRRKQKEDGGDGSGEEEEEVEEKMDSLRLKKEGGEEAANKEPSTVTVESGAFTVTSTVGLNEEEAAAAGAGNMGQSQPKKASWNIINAPCPRFNARLAVKQGQLYVFGGMVEDGDATFTLKDLYSVDIHKFDEWTTLIESDLKSMEWFDSDSEGSDDDDDDDDEDDEDDDGDDDDDMEEG